MTDLTRHAPARIGRYQVLGPLGSGGMASVYLALSRGAAGFSREVAIKLLHPHLLNDKHLVEQFLNEGRVAARIRHPNVVPVIDVAEEHGSVYLVMDFVEGDSLSGLRRAARRAERELPPRIWLRFMCDALAGLHAAHEVEDDEGVPLGLVHRDFSPQNILVGLDGVARLSDFGIAKLTAGGGNTASGVVKGKLQYMSPEQVQAKPLDRRCDVWAAGIVCWELATGRRLRKQRDAEIQTLLEVVNVDPPDVRAVRPELPAPLAKAIARALTRKLDARCPTAGDFRRQLLAAAESSGGVADHEECAAWVREVSLETIRERRRKLNEAKQLREKLDELIDVGDDSQSSSVSSARSGASAESEHTGETHSTLSRDTGPKRPPRRWLKPLVAVGVVLAAWSAGLWFRANQKVPALERAQGVSTLLASAAARTTPPPPPPTANPSLKVSANDEIATLSADGRKIEIEKPARELELSLPEWARDRAELKLDATSVRGARASLLTRKGEPARIEFDLVAPAPAPRATPVKRPGKKPLAGNPYGD